MKKDICIAAARLIYDVIGADGYLSDREIDILENYLNDKYGLLNPEWAYDVNSKTFCDALEYLQENAEEKDVNELLDDLKLIAGVGALNEKNQCFSRLEGYCSLNEAWLLFTIEYALKEKAVVFSVKKKDYRFARSEIIYLENSNNNYSLYEEMRMHYGEYKSRLELYGMRLIYIPAVSAYLKKKREQRKLKSIMRYVSPFHRYEDQDAQRIVDNIDKISTMDFARDLFSQDGNIFKALRPSFLLKISTSRIGGKGSEKKANFILIPIEGSIDDTLQKALSRYREYTLERHIPDRKLHGRPFKLHGFDKTFLNFVMSHELNTERLTKILFDFSSFQKRCVQFQFSFCNKERNVTLPLNNKPMCLYLLVILFTTYKKGVALERVIKKKSSIKLDVEKVFCSIYNKVKEKCKGDLYDGRGRIYNDISRVEQKMKDIPSDYHVVTKDGRVTVNFPCKDIIYVKFNKVEKLLSDEIETRKCEGKKLEDILCEIFV